ncbi:phytanoyl-CoA dioxygenase family protein [Sphingomonas sp.]|uniref:phytanoyl-CoA dioxygenase family protein n=1 Tax=Sphingomonas sp. TaxID=28214 RepID=UPI003B3B317B
MFGIFKKRHRAPIGPRKSRLPLPRSLFDEARYLAYNPDVAAAVARGETQAYRHYVDHGHSDEQEGRRPASLPIVSTPIVPQRNAPDALLDRVIDLETEKKLLLEVLNGRLPSAADIDFSMLSETVDDALVPPLDRAELDEGRLDEDQRAWRRDGFIIKPGFIPDALIDTYCSVRARVPNAGGWACPVPYMHIPELRAISLYPPLVRLLGHLIGEEMGLHLNLTGWISTDRNWHQDDYLNPPYVNSWYAAVWIALDDIHPDCGPFEFVPGSHRWPLLKSHRVRLFLNETERMAGPWPTLAERFVNDAVELEITRRGAMRKRFIARKGDTLIWHGRLMHRGSYANVPGMERRALIGHYSGITHRMDMPEVAYTSENCAYFVHDMPIDFDPYADTPTSTES